MNAKPLYLLIAEDEEAHVELISRAFEKSGVELHAVGTLLEFHACVAERTPDIALVDLNLPDGKAVEILAFPPEYAAFPVIVMTAYGDQQIVVDIMKAGALDYVVKSSEAFAFLPRVVERVWREWGLLQDRKQATVKLYEANVQLAQSVKDLKITQQKVIQQERLAALGQMASGIAHDFNNVLMPIIGYSELMLEDPSILNDRKEVIHMLKTINSAGNDARQIVSRLRMVYRKEDNAEYELIDLSRIVEGAISLTMPKWKEEMNAKGATIEMATDFQSVPQINGNAAELREVLTNLIFNAVDAMPKGGVITFCIQCENNAAIVLEVTDTGTGMDQETLNHCKELFFTTKGVQGSGLGLSMVNGIIERHGGALEIESKPGAGTTIRLRFPVSVETECADIEKNEESAPIPPLRVLVIDDEAQSRVLVATYLKNDDHYVEMAKEGKEGLDLLCHGKFDLVITDRAMPGMGGDEVAGKVQEIRPGIPVIMLTGFGDIMKDSGKCPSGVSRVMSKPVSIKELRRVMASVLRKIEEAKGS